MFVLAALLLEILLHSLGQAPEKSLCARMNLILAVDAPPCQGIGY